MWKIGVDDGLIFIVVVSSHFLVQFEGTGIARSYIQKAIPR